MKISKNGTKEYSHFCMGCMNDKGLETICPECGFNEKKVQRGVFFLPYRVILNDQFLVGRPLGVGGFGITYLGYDLKLEIVVAIKEFISRDFADRDSSDMLRVTPFTNKEEEFKYGLESFLKEAKTLAKFYHPNVMRIKTYFEENDTAYRAYA